MLSDDDEAIVILRDTSDSRNRVRTMALIHEKLYESDDLKGVDFAGYIESLATDMVGSYGAGAESVRLVVDTQPVVLGLDKATPCGLIINEVISNALTHFQAVPAERSVNQPTFPHEILETVLLQFHATCALRRKRRGPLCPFARTRYKLFLLSQAARLR